MRASVLGLFVVASAAIAVAADKVTANFVAPPAEVQRSTQLDGWTFAAVESGERRLGVLAFRTDDKQAGARGVFWFDGQETDWRPYVFTGDDLGRAVTAIEHEFLGTALLRGRGDVTEALALAGAAVADHALTGEEFIVATNGYVAQFIYAPEDEAKFPGVLIGDDPGAPLYPRRVPCRTGHTNPNPTGTEGSSRPPIDVLPFMSAGGTELAPVGDVLDAPDSAGVDSGAGALASTGPACEPWTDWAPEDPNWTFTQVVSLPGGDVECRYSQIQWRQRTCRATVGCRLRVYMAREMRALDTIACTEPGAPCPAEPTCLTQ
ncbi:hypothetical protein RAS1_26380 [Phycisphaerae bacterium RAS1]|nr:hypothetical protein RAS1_26380 [Phycisphaerae bacterium RAS1]